MIWKRKRLSCERYSNDSAGGAQVWPMPSFGVVWGERSRRIEKRLSGRLRRWKKPIPGFAPPADDSRRDSPCTAVSFLSEWGPGVGGHHLETM